MTVVLKYKSTSEVWHFTINKQYVPSVPAFMRDYYEQGDAIWLGVLYDSHD